jgi:hypothetical protein
MTVRRLCNGLNVIPVPSVAVLAKVDFKFISFSFSNFRPFFVTKKSKLYCNKVIDFGANIGVKVWLKNFKVESNVI